MPRSSLTVKTLLLAMGNGLAALAHVLGTAILTRTLTMEGLATHRQVLMIYATMAPFLMLGLPKALFYFLPGEQKRARGLLIENLLLLATGGLLFGVALWAGLNGVFAQRFNNPAVAGLALLLLPYALFLFPISALDPCLLARGAVKRLVAFNIVSQLSLLAILAFAATIWRTPRASISAYVVWAGVVLVPGLTLMFLSVRGTRSRPTRAGMWDQVRFSVPIGVAGLVGSVSMQVDKFIVSSMCKPEDFAVYSTGAMEIPVIGMITGAMMTAILPDLVLLFKKGQHDELVMLWQRAMGRSLSVLAPLMFAVLLLAPELMAVVFSATYRDSSLPLRIFVLILPLRSAVYSSVLMATNNTRYVTVSAVVGLTLNLVFCVGLVHLIGPNGAAWAGVIATYGVVVSTLWPMARSLRRGYLSLIDWKAVGKTMLAAGLPALPVLALSPWIQLSDLLRLLLLGGLYTALLAVAYRIVGLDPVRDVLLAVLRSRGRKGPPVQSADVIGS